MEVKNNIDFEKILNQFNKLARVFSLKYFDSLIKEGKCGNIFVDKQKDLISKLVKRVDKLKRMEVLNHLDNCLQELCDLNIKSEYVNQNIERLQFSISKIKGEIVEAKKNDIKDKKNLLNLALENIEKKFFREASYNFIEASELFIETGNDLLKSGRKDEAMKEFLEARKCSNKAKIYLDKSSGFFSPKRNLELLIKQLNKKVVGCFNKAWGVGEKKGKIEKRMASTYSWELEKLKKFVEKRNREDKEDLIKLKELLEKALRERVDNAILELQECGKDGKDVNEVFEDFKFAFGKLTRDFCREFVYTKAGYDFFEFDETLEDMRKSKKEGDEQRFRKMINRLNLAKKDEGELIMTHTEGFEKVKKVFDELVKEQGELGNRTIGEFSKGARSISLVTVRKFNEKDFSSKVSSRARSKSCGSGKKKSEQKGSNVNFLG